MLGASRRHSEVRSLAHRHLGPELGEKCFDAWADDEARTAA